MIIKIKERNRLYIKTLKNPQISNIHNDRLKHLSQEINRLRKNLKRTYFAQKLNEAGTNTKTAWNVIHQYIGKPSKDENICKSFSNNGETITGNSNIAEQFCNYFSSIASDLASKVQTPTSGGFTDYLNPQPQNSAFFSPTSPQEIEHLCQGLDPSKGPGHDGLTPKSSTSWLTN